MLARTTRSGLADGKARHRVTAYANSINGKHYGFAVALAIAGLAITAIASASALNQATAGGKAQDALRDMEGRIAGRLDADSIRIVKHQGRSW